MDFDEYIASLQRDDDDDGSSETIGKEESSTSNESSTGKDSSSTSSNINGDSPLLAAVSSQNRTLVTLLAERTELNVYSAASKWTPLHIAVHQKSMIMVNTLLRAFGVVRFRAAINLRNDLGHTPLLCACKNNNVSMVRLLLAQGADPNLRYWWNSTALFTAASRDTTFDLRKDGDFLEIAKLLLAYGADPTLRCELGSTPLITAAAAGFGGMVELLLSTSFASSSSFVNARDCTGQTALHRAATYPRGRLQMVQTLLRHGADPSIESVTHQRPADVAMEGQVERLLRSVKRAKHA